MKYRNFAKFPAVEILWKCTVSTEFWIIRLNSPGTLLFHKIRSNFGILSGALLTILQFFVSCTTIYESSSTNHGSCCLCYVMFNCFIFVFPKLKRICSENMDEYWWYKLYSSFLILATLTFSGYVQYFVP